MKKFNLVNAKNLLPIRKTSDNKNAGGKVLIIAGSPTMHGAAILSALAAARTGAGYVYLYTSGKFPIARHPDFLLLKQTKNFKTFQSVAIGPGFKNFSKIKSTIERLKKEKLQNVVLDAEALNFLAKKPTQLPSSWILTPHEGELSRILKVSSSAIQKNRQKYIQLAQKKLGCIVLLKGYRTLVADKKSIWEIQSGNPALGKAGTGDVLTGMIASFLAQGLSPLQSAKLAAFVHGYIADQWLIKKDVLSLMASDVVKAIPETLLHIRRAR